VSNGRRGRAPPDRPRSDVEFKGAPDWFADAANIKRWGLGEIPLAYDPPGAPEFLLDEKSDAPDLARCWVQKSPARQLVNLKDIPVLVVTSEASYHASYDHCTIKYLRQVGLILPARPSCALRAATSMATAT
jgi:hypothetical protein